MDEILNALHLYPVVEDQEEKYAYVLAHGNRSKKYSDTPLSILISWILVRAKMDSGVKSYLKDHDLFSEEALYRKITGNSSTCPNGKTAKFRGIDRGYESCGRIDVCPCVAARTIQTNIEKYGSSRPIGNAEVRAKIEATNIERYGAANPMKNDTIVEKLKATNRDRYGVDHILQGESFREKARETLRERHGVDVPIHSPEIRGKMIETNRERFGCDYAISSEEVRENIRKTNLRDHGTEYYVSTEEFQNKKREKDSLRTDEEKALIVDRRKQTNLLRYGGTASLTSPSIVEKIRLTNQARYGVDFPFQNREIRDKCVAGMTDQHDRLPSQVHISPENLAILEDAARLQELVGNDTLVQAAKKLGVHYTTISNYYARHGIDLPQSSYEVAIANHLTECGVDFISNTRKIIPPLELDFYLPQHSLAIEFNGLYWHSSLHKDANYHREKYEACRNAGIRLLMINEDEWGEPVKNKITNLLGLSPRGVGARKLLISKVANSEANAFFAKHHIQGSTGSLIAAYGARLGHDLVACIGYTKQRGTGAIELIRFCTNGPTYAGAFTRIFKHSVMAEQYADIVSFADLRYSDGGLYEKNGFDLVGEIRPDYRYVVNGSTYHKSSFKKSDIAKKFNVDVSQKTERHLMEELGIPRIYDCGKIKYRWQK